MSLLTGLAGWEARAAQAHYRVGELAELLGYSPNYLRRYFHEKFGFNLRARLQQLRLHRLKTLMQQRWRLKWIAACLGFNHVSNLCRFFKQIVGISIRVYRRVLNLQPSRPHGPNLIETTSICRSSELHANLTADPLIFVVGPPPSPPPSPLIEGPRDKPESRGGSIMITLRACAPPTPPL